MVKALITNSLMHDYNAIKIHSAVSLCINGSDAQFRGLLLMYADIR